jgi:hypothetical protein
MKNKLLIALILSFFFLSSLKAQYPALQLSIGFGSPIFATDMILCNNSSLLISGYDSSAANRSVILINIDTSGNIIWQRKLSNSVTSKFDAIKVIQTSDNGFCLAGRYIFPNGDTTIGLFKTNSTGQALWDVQFKPTGGGFRDAALDVSESSDSSLYVSGYYYPSVASTQPSPWIAKVNANGQLIWFKELNVLGGEAVRTVIVSDTQIVVGINETGSMRHPVIAFMDSSGTLTKANRIHRFNYTDMELVDLYADTSNQIVSLNMHDSLGKISIAHYFTTSNGNPLEYSFQTYLNNHDLRIKKCDKPFAESFSLLEISDTIANTLIGLTDDAVPVFENWMIDTVYHSLPVGMQYTGNWYQVSCYVAANIPYSVSQSGIIFTKTDNPLSYFNGSPPPCNGMYLTTFQNVEYWADSIYLFNVINLTGSISATNPVLTSSATSYQASVLCNTTSVEENILSNFSVQEFPNPVSTNATFQITGFDGNKTLIIYDQLGKEIWEKESVENQIEFSAENFSSGLYFYRVTLENGNTVSGKFIIQ